MAKTARCSAHQALAANARCGACNRGLCNDCFRFRLGGRAACAPCAFEASTRPARRLSLGASFLCFATVGGFWLDRRQDLLVQDRTWLFFGAMLVLIVAVAVACSGRGATAEVERREPEEDQIGDLDLAGSNQPYRAHVRRAILAASPKVSGSAAALVVLASFAVSAVLLPAAVHLPRWIEAELVLALWWAIVAGTLASLLHTGFRLRDDYLYYAPWQRHAPPSPADGPRASPKSGWGIDGVGVLVGLEGEGCVAVVVLGLVLVVAFGAAWVFVELVMPVAFFVMYWLFMRAIRHVARDHRGCQGDLAKSVGWAVVWATVYVAPVGVVTWIAHAVHHHY